MTTTFDTICKRNNVFTIPAIKKHTGRMPLKEKNRNFPLDARVHKNIETHLLEKLCSHFPLWKRRQKMTALTVQSANMPIHTAIGPKL